MRKISFKEFSTIRNYTATLGHKVSTHYYQKKKKCQKTHIAKLSNLKVACSKKLRIKTKTHWWIYLRLITRRKIMPNSLLTSIQGEKLSMQGLTGLYFLRLCLAFPMLIFSYFHCLFFYLCANPRSLDYNLGLEPEVL